MARIKNICFLFVLLLTATFANAHDFKIGGVYYNIISKTTNVEVCAGETFYSGNIEIPPTVTYSEQTYNVTRIGENAFNNCTGLTSISIPASVTFTGEYNQEIKGETNVEIISVIA